MTFSAYTSYKHSNVDWLGRVPDEWNTFPLWSLFRRVKRTGCPDEELLSVYRDHGVVRKSDRTDNFNKSSEDLSSYQLVCEGDLAINKMKAWQGSVAISSLRGIVSPAYFVYAKTHQESDEFLHYLMRSKLYISIYRSISKGIRPNQWDIDPDCHCHLPVLLPPLVEQITIAAFLDQETAKIDELVTEQRRLISLMKEKRQALISHAVTKGLDPQAPMRHSRFEGLGEIPTHWDVIPLKRLVHFVTSGPRGWSDFITDEGDLFFQSQNIGSDMTVDISDCARINVPPGPDADRSRLAERDIVVCITGGRTGAIAIVENLDEDTYVNQHVCLIRVNISKILPRYLAYFLFSEFGQKQLQLSMYGLKQGLSLDDIKNISVAVPDIAEQQLVVNLLDTGHDVIRSLNVEAALAITLLMERREALVSAAVTGKIDVRSSATMLPFHVDRTHARGLLAVEIIERSAGRTTFGRVKLQKVAYLAECHVGITEIGGTYVREAAGPLDRGMIGDMESEAAVLSGVQINQPGGAGTAVTYKPSQQQGAHRQELAGFLGVDRAAKLDALIRDMLTLDTKGAEAVATLYAVWNDALIEGEKLTDDEIVAAFLSEWHPEKAKKFRPYELHDWLGWMRRHDLVPAGCGPKTTTGRLFA